MILKKASINSGYTWYLLKPFKVIENKVIFKQRDERTR